MALVKKKDLYKKKSFEFPSNSYSIERIGGRTKSFEEDENISFTHIEKGVFYVQFLDFNIKVKVHRHERRDSIVYKFIEGGGVKGGLWVILDFYIDSDELCRLEIRFKDRIYLFFPKE